MEPQPEDYVKKEVVLEMLCNRSLSLRMTYYVYDPDFLYEAIFRIRNNFKVSTVGYFD